MYRDEGVRSRGWGREEGRSQAGKGDKMEDVMSPNFDPGIYWLNYVNNVNK